MAIPKCIRNLGTATKGIVKRGVDKLIPSTATGRVLLSLGLLAVIAALTIAWTGVASQCTGGLTPAVPLTIERLQQVLPHELANYGLEIGAVEALESWTLLMNNRAATYVCGSCFDGTTSVLEVAEHCSRIYQNFQGNICPAMEVLDAEFFWRGINIRDIWGSSLNLERFVTPHLEVLAKNWLNALKGSA